MHPPQQFALVSKTYSDGISLRKDGPQIKKEFGSEFAKVAGRSYRTAATFVPKLVPKRFLTTLTVGDDLTYCECVAFEPRTVMRDFSETTSIFLPKDAVTRYCSSLFYDPDATAKRYVVGTELIPGKKIVVVSSNSEGESDATEWNGKTEINGDIIGRVHHSEPEKGTFLATQKLDVNERPAAHYREHCIVNGERGHSVFHAIQWAYEVAHPAA